MSEFNEKIKKYLIKLGIISGLIYVFLFFSYSHFNVFEPCFVKIRVPVIASSKAKIKKAIKFLKRSDHAAYGTFCRHVNTIVESDCLGSDWHLSNEIRGQDAPGCYVKGSKTIYLNPLKTRAMSEEKISELLKENSELSQEFWISR